MENINSNNIYILVGHKIPNKPEAFAIFIGKPTKEQLLNTNTFNNNELDNKLIDCLLKHEICGTYRESTDFRYEYFFCHPKENGDLNLGDYLYTGILDMRQELLVKL